MDERRRTSPKDDDVPIIGDYSEVANARLRPEPPLAPPAEPTRAPPRPTEEQWRVDPRDISRHAKLKRQREKVGPLGRISRYALLVVALVAAFLAYRNFETLRSIEIDFSAITSLISGDSGTGVHGPAGSNGDVKKDDFAPPQVVGVEAASAVGGAPPAQASAAETPAVRPEPPAAQSAATAETSPPAVAAAEPSPEDERDASPALAPPAAPEPPPGPESFEFGLSTVTVSEAEASASVIVLRNGDRRRASSITWWTEDGTAKAGTDYVNLGRVAEKFAAGEQNRTIHIPIVGDHKVEGPETFYVYLAPGDGADPAAESAGKLEVVINDD